MPRPLLGQEEEGQLSPLWQDILLGLSFQTGAYQPYRIRLAGPARKFFGLSEADL